MKLKEGFILRTVAGETVALPAGGVTNLDMMITLNDTGKFLWEKLESGAEKDERERAEKSVYAFAARLKELDFLA